MNRIWQFLKSVALSAWRAIKAAVLQIIQNWEATCVITLATIGAAYVVSEIPYMTGATLAVEGIIAAPYVAPALGITLVALLITSIRLRTANEVAV